MDFIIRQLKIEDYEEVRHLWETEEKIKPNYADTYENINRYINRNTQFSYVAEEKNTRKLVGVVLCGHDGRHGYIYHVNVHKLHRRKKIGTSLINRCFEELSGADIKKCHIFVFVTNKEAIAFWEEIGWFKRDEFLLMSNWTGEKPE